MMLRILFTGPHGLYGSCTVYPNTTEKGYETDSNRLLCSIIFYFGYGFSDVSLCMSSNSWNDKYCLGLGMEEILVPRIASTTYDCGGDLEEYIML